MSVVYSKPCGEAPTSAPSAARRSSRPRTTTAAAYVVGSRLSPAPCGAGAGPGSRATTGLRGTSRSSTRRAARGTGSRRPPACRRARRPSRRRGSSCSSKRVLEAADAVPDDVLHARGRRRPGWRSAWPELVAAAVRLLGLRVRERRPARRGGGSWLTLTSSRTRPPSTHALKSPVPSASSMLNDSAGGRNE